MRFFAAFLGLVLVSSLCSAAVIQQRNYRNTQEILVPVAIIQDGEEIKEPADLQKNINLSQNKILRTEAAIAEAAAVQEEQKLEAVEAVLQAQRRLDEAIIEEEIEEAVQEEQNKEEEIKASEEKNEVIPVLVEQPQLVPVVEIEKNEAIKKPVKKVEQTEDTDDTGEVLLILEANNGPANDSAEHPDGAIRQATQSTPVQTTTQQNFVQQLIQNSPLGQFFNQITGQNNQNQVASDDAVTTAAPPLFNPVAAVQNAAQTVVNTTTQAFQGLQQFASNLGNQFQNTLSSLGGQQQGQNSNNATTPRPPGPIQQLVNSFIGNPQQAQPAPSPQGPLQGLLNIFQGNNRPQATAATPVEPTRETEIVENTQTASAEATDNNELRDSAENNDSFEDSIPPGELIVVNDDAVATENQ